jgi:Domain of unknown function (DUF4386)
MNADSFERAPQAYARANGLMYLAIIALGLFGEAFARGAVIVSGDAAATAANLVAHESLWRVGIAGDLLMHVLDIPVIVFFYLLLRPVDKGLALLSTAFNIVQTSVLALNKSTLIVPLALLDQTNGSMSLGQDAQALMSLSIDLHGYGFGTGLIFFGLASIVRGYLIVKSGFLPKTLGVLLQLAGLCYLINSFALLLAPSLASMLFPWILLPPFIGELLLAGWLLIKGIDVARWRALLGSDDRPDTP